MWPCGLGFPALSADFNGACPDGEAAEPPSLPVSAAFLDSGRFFMKLMEFLNHPHNRYFFFSSSSWLLPPLGMVILFALHTMILERAIDSWGGRSQPRLVHHLTNFPFNEIGNRLNKSTPVRSLESVVVARSQTQATNPLRKGNPSFGWAKHLTQKRKKQWTGS